MLFFVALWPSEVRERDPGRACRRRSERRPPSAGTIHGSSPRGDVLAYGRLQRGHAPSILLQMAERLSVFLLHVTASHVPASDPVKRRQEPSLAARAEPDRSRRSKVKTRSQPRFKCHWRDMMRRGTPFAAPMPKIASRCSLTDTGEIWTHAFPAPTSTRRPDLGPTSSSMTSRAGCAGRQSLSAQHILTGPVVHPPYSVYRR